MLSRYLQLAYDKEAQLEKQLAIIRSLSSHNITFPEGVMHFFRVEREISLRHAREVKDTSVMNVLPSMQKCIENQTTLHDKTASILMSNYNVCERLKKLTSD